MADYPEQRPSTLERIGDWVNRNKEALLLTLGGLMTSEAINLTNIVPDDFIRNAVENQWGEDAFIDEDPILDWFPEDDWDSFQIFPNINSPWDSDIVPVNRAEKNYYTNAFSTVVENQFTGDDADDIAQEIEGYTDDALELVINDNPDALGTAISGLTDVDNLAEYRTWVENLPDEYEEEFTAALARRAPESLELLTDQQVVDLADELFGDESSEVEDMESEGGLADQAEFIRDEAMEDFD
ncbi:hypothetical protein GF362_01560 [Candidatus Dojkabacteria bacterium]|nr:hypothetical protein [Candidatus Dojkabacteria bacterium]